MSHRDRSRQLFELNEFAKRVGWWPSVCERIAAGASVPALCAEHVLPVAAFRFWVDADPEREQQYQRALQERAERRLAERVAKRAMRKSAKQRAEKTGGGELRAGAVAGE